MSEIKWRISGEQAKEQEMKDMLKKQGFNTEGMNFNGGFGGSGLDPDQMAKILKAQKQENEKKDL